MLGLTLGGSGGTEGGCVSDWGHDGGHSGTERPKRGPDPHIRMDGDQGGLPRDPRGGGWSRLEEKHMKRLGRVRVPKGRGQVTVQRALKATVSEAGREHEQRPEADPSFTPHFPFSFPTHKTGRS